VLHSADELAGALKGEGMRVIEVISDRASGAALRRDLGQAAAAAVDRQLRAR
jgi:hypothetical protein